MIKNNTKSILLILLAMVLFSIQDTLIKFIYNDVALFELYFGRIVIGLLLIIAYLLFSKKKIILKTYYPFLTSIRVILQKAK